MYNVGNKAALSILLDAMHLAVHAPLFYASLDSADVSQIHNIIPVKPTHKSVKLTL